MRKLTGKVVSFFKSISFGALAAGLVVLSALTVAGYFGHLHRHLEMASHLRVLYAIAFLPCLSLLFAMKRWKSFAVASVFFIINAIPIVELYIPPASTARGPAQREISVMQVNTWGVRNPHYDKVLKAIKDNSPDLVGVSEITRTWDQKLRDGLSDYPYRVIEQRYGGVAVFSKYPLIDGKVLFTEGAVRRPRITATMQLPEGDVSIIFAHTVVPNKHYPMRNREMSTLASEAREAKNPVIVFGDLNCSPFSYYFGRLMRDGKLQDTERGFGLQPTWTTHTYLPWVTIDHCLTSSDFVTLQRKTGPKVGSDHLPVLVKLALHRP